MEYQQCAESYRHTYATIWQAGGLFGIVSGALVGLSASDGTLPPIIQVLAPLPLLFWYLGIFRPMNRYGELRGERLAEIELILGGKVSGLCMKHFCSYEESRKSESRLSCAPPLKWVREPRVSEMAAILGAALIVGEFYLVWTLYL